MIQSTFTVDPLKYAMFRVCQAEELEKLTAEGWHLLGTVMQPQRQYIGDRHAYQDTAIEMFLVGLLVDDVEGWRSRTLEIERAELAEARKRCEWLEQHEPQQRRELEQARRDLSQTREKLQKAESEVNALTDALMRTRAAAKENS
jgi:hypothetical protein